MSRRQATRCGLQVSAPVAGPSSRRADSQPAPPGAATQRAPLDWQRPGAEIVADRIVSETSNRAVVLFHDIHPGTIDAMPLATAAWNIPNRRLRIETFLNLDPSNTDTAYQQWRSIQALARASPLGPNHASTGPSPPDSLPFAATDFILPALGETWGVAICLLVLPASGLPLPLVSAGGSNLIATSMILGILWRIRSEALTHVSVSAPSPSPPNQKPLAVGAELGQTPADAHHFSSATEHPRNSGRSPQPNSRRPFI